MTNKPRIVLWDIETLPNLKEAMRVFPGLGDYPGLTLKASINSVICVGWKELGSSQVNCINAWDFKTRWQKNVNDDLSVVKAAYQVLKNADVVVTHNGKRFDWRFLQTRLLLHGLPPLPKIIHIDTCQEAKKHLYMFNNRLNTLAKHLTDTEKKENGGWALWTKVIERDAKSMKLMTDYCKQDVRVLEGIFERLRPLIKGLPDRSGGGIACASCSGPLLRRGMAVKRNLRVQRYQCKVCGAWSQEHGIGVKEL